MCIIVLSFQERLISGRQFQYSPKCFVEIVILCVKPDHRTKASGGPAYRKNIVPSKISKCHYLGMGRPKMLSLVSPSQGFKFYPQHHFTMGLLGMGIWFLKEETRHCQPAHHHHWQSDYLPMLPSCGLHWLNQLNLGCFWIQYMFVKTLTSPLCFGQAQIGLSRDTNFYLVWPSSFHQNFSKHRP